MTDAAPSQSASVPAVDVDLAGLLAQSRDQQKMMMQFFAAIGAAQKDGLRANDIKRLTRYRSIADYAEAFSGDPLISVIIPTYNRVDTLLERTIPSVLEQSYPHWELIIVGDQMREEDYARLARACEADSRIRLHNLKFRGRYPAQAGPRWYVAGTKPVNFGLRVARGRWISHLDDDDTFLPDHLETLLRQAQSERREWVHASVQFIGDNGLVQRTVGAATPVQGGIARIGSLYHAALKGFRYNPQCWQYYCPGDWDLWDRFMAMGVKRAACNRVTAVHHGDYFRPKAIGDQAVHNGRVTYAEWTSQLIMSPQLSRRLPVADGLPSIAVVVRAGTGSFGKLDLTLGSLARQSFPAVRIDIIECEQAGIIAERYQTDRIVCHPQAVVSDWRPPAPWVMVLEAGDRLPEHALLIAAEHACRHPQVRFWYGDEDRVALGLPGDPIFKPDFNLDLLRSYAYVGRAVMLCSELYEAPADGGAFEEPCWHLDQLYRIYEAKGRGAIGHVPEILLHTENGYAAWLGRTDVIDGHRKATVDHLARSGIQAEVEHGAIPSIQRVRYHHATQPLVSIIIPNKNQFVLLAGLIESIAGKTAYPNYEVLIVDNGSTEPDACNYLAGLERLASPSLRVLRYPHPFNYSAINNFAAREARGEYLVLLNNDTVVIEPNWLQEMLNHAQRDDVGVVGAKLYYPDGRIQHGGVVLGLNGPADHPFIGEPMDASGYMHRLQVDQNYSAVTAACLMIRHSLFDEVGGLDEVDFKVCYNDVDLCLKVVQAGYLVVWTPYAQLIHHGSVSQNSADAVQGQAKLTRFGGEQEAMYRRWMPMIANDPAYNHNLSLSAAGFGLDAYRHIAWQPFSTPVLPRLVCHPADRTGCGHYRVRQPFEALRQAAMVDGTVTEALLSPAVLERFETDTIILQRQHTDVQREAMRRYLQFSQAFKVYELDDYMFNLPLKSVHRSHVPKDMRRQLRHAVSMTDRFVVSTEVLAEQLSDMHQDIRVAHNRLPTQWWTGLKAERRVGSKPRVGWGGGSSHTGDLELIADVIRELANEVDWVFFGMCPEKLRPYVREYHGGVPIEQYPAKLASLNLDLALAPLEDNLFNHCKSNLRLLEYGACGFPVVCSDLITYRDDLPVTRVKNRFKDWVSAIRMHLSDLDATAIQGDALQKAVLERWMLSGDNLVAWRDVWLP